MDHGHGGEPANHHAHDFDPLTPVRSPLPIEVTPALDRSEFVAEILLSRALSISRSQRDEAIIVVAHGPVTDEENARWVSDMESLAAQMKKGSTFRRVEYLTVRDDAPEPIRAKATAELRATVERAGREGLQVLIVPLLLSYGGIEAGIRKRLEGLDYKICSQALLPDDRLAKWVLLSAKIEQ
jgi:hypothetical protein